ncbi:MAG TPA: hypothetical protein VNM40_01090 [Candidatus Paceibacterota bacterium]|nr:hypothetical protein [Candidatus Paceibacterota bacterium]
MFQPREKFVSSELQFTDPSPAGLHIMPASCASDPTYNHLNLPQTSDGGGYYVNTGVVEGGLTKDFDPSARLDIKYVCVTNNTGSTYFIPATTKAELQTFINLGSSVPNLQVWGQ